MKRSVKIIVGIIGGLIIVSVAYHIIVDWPCRTLRKLGFHYTKTGGWDSPSWDILLFSFFIDVKRSGIGPEIAGDCLKVKCRDVDGDGLPEFIIQSQIYKTYRTILKVDPKVGGYHVYSTKGLGVAYPEEGYNYL
jgi:hypothetical protein